MKRQEIQTLLEECIKVGKDFEINIDKRAKIKINIKKLTGPNYISTVKYFLDRQEVHFGTLRTLIDRLVVSDIDQYFQEDIWKTTSAHGENNKDGMLNLISELLKIDTMDVIMHPKYHYNQWKARNPYVSYKALKNGRASGYHKNYKGWLNEGIEKGFVSKDEFGDMDDINIIEDYIHSLEPIKDSI